MGDAVSMKVDGAVKKAGKVVVACRSIEPGRPTRGQDVRARFVSEDGEVELSIPVHALEVKCDGRREIVFAKITVGNVELDMTLDAAQVETKEGESEP